MPARPKKTDVSAFPSWDELVAEAHVDLPPYQLPLPPIKNTETGEVVQESEVIEIPVLKGDAYISLTMAQARGDAASMLFTLFPDNSTRARVMRATAGADFRIVDVITSKVLRHFYGLDIKRDPDGSDDEAAEEAAGKSDAA